MRSIKTIFTTVFFMALLLSSGSSIAKGDPLPESEGLWEYTGLITSDGKSLPLTGIFLIKDGVFLQQSIFNGQPFSEQGSMAHAGACWAGGAGLRLTANQTISMSPVEDQKLVSMGETEHDLAVTRDDSQLTLVFGAGTSTVQTFDQIGSAEDTRVFNFSDGALAFANGYFILVAGGAESATTGYGKYKHESNVLTLEVIRWSQSDGTSTKNEQDITLQASFDGSVLQLPDGQTFSVVP